MFRRVFTGVSVFSLLLCVAAVAMWVTSYRAATMAGRTVVRDRGDWSARAVGWSRGGVVCMNIRCPAGTFPEWAGPGLWYHREWEPHPEPRAGTFWQRVGFEYKNVGDSRMSVVHVEFPLWFVAGLLLIAPAAKLAGHWRRGWAHRQGLCPRCGYDLRATPRRCPECGTRVVAEPA